MATATDVLTIDFLRRKLEKAPDGGLRALNHHLRLESAKKYLRESQTYRGLFYSGVRTRKENCEVCGAGRDEYVTKGTNILRKREIIAHHHDYSRPLDVVFLCKTCHYKVHAK